MANVTRIEGKRGVTYRIDYIDPKGKRIRRMFKKKKEADAELAKRVSLMAEGRYLDVKKDTKVTLKELFDRYGLDCQKQKCFHTHKRVWIQSFIDFMGRKLDTAGERIKASAVTWALISEWISELENTPTKRIKTDGVRQPAAVNRAIGAIRHMFNMAVEWDMIERSPFEKARRVARKESKHRERFLTKEEIARLLREFEHLPYLHRVVEFAILTGLDKSDILNLKWNDIQKRLILENGEEVEIEHFYHIYILGFQPFFS